MSLLNQRLYVLGGGVHLLRCAGDLCHSLRLLTVIYKHEFQMELTADRRTQDETAQWGKSGVPNTAFVFKLSFFSLEPKDHVPRLLM